MLRQLQRIGIYNNPGGYLYLEQHLSETLKTSVGVVQENGRVLRESILMGPNGGLLVKSYWENNRLITVILLGGN